MSGKAAFGLEALVRSRTELPQEKICCLRRTNQALYRASTVEPQRPPDF